MRTIKAGLLYALLFLVVTVTGQVAAQQAPVALTGAMVDSVSAFLNALSDEQRGKASYGFDDEERLNWHFIPRPRNGLSFNDMTPAQQTAATDVLEVFLSAKGFDKVQQIRSLESVLAEIEVNGRFVRDPAAYFLTVFGTPSQNGTWAFRFEGHHIALNWTFIAGHGIASSPQFFGTNPAEVASGANAGLRVLATEEDLGRQLAASLDSNQRRQGVLETDVPRDIITAAEVEITPFESSGIPYSALNAAQQRMLMTLIEEIASAQPEAIAAARLASIHANAATIRFTWIGGTGSRDPHYYRVQGDDFLIEYDKTQNDANHIHLVWRDFDGDFGRDLIRMHYDAVAAAYGPGHVH